jgi:squalene-hopene/tetraprenyl-beta-curcumene cyclase
MMKQVMTMMVLAGLILGCGGGKKTADPTTSVAKAGELKLSATLAGTTVMSAEAAAKASELINGGVEYLASKVNANGGWDIQGRFEPAITALVLKCLIQHPSLTMETPLVKRGYDRLLAFQQEDGAIYDPKQGRDNYCTAIAVCALAAANDPALKTSMDKAILHLRALQIRPGTVSRDKEVAGQKITKGHPYVGGVSYGKHGRPDLNNVGWWMQAMNDADVPADDPDVQSALSFVLRCQDRKESNSMAWAQEGENTGGIIYAPAARDITKAESKANSQAGTYTAKAGLAPYGSMTYVGLKSMLYAGLSKDDPRVKAAYLWLRKHYTLEKNPNMAANRPEQGRYFYYNVFAKGLRAFGKDEVIDPADPTMKHNWRNDLVAQLAKLVSKDGSWMNPADRWEEGSPILVTAYEVLALQEALKK